MMTHIQDKLFTIRLFYIRLYILLQFIVATILYEMLSCNFSQYNPEECLYLSYKDRSDENRYELQFKSLRTKFSSVLVIAGVNLAHIAAPPYLG